LQRNGFFEKNQEIGLAGYGSVCQPLFDEVIPLGQRISSCASDDIQFTIKPVVPRRDVLLYW
jgi:hypothetical protein